MRTGTLILLFLTTSCSPTKFFYYPTKQLYLDPHHLKIDYDMMEFKSKNGKKLFGLYFQTKQEPKGIVVHFHGNYGNVSNHFIGSSFLINHGFDVLIFDYQSYGGSEGKKVSPKLTVEDGLAALNFAKTLNRNPKKNLYVLGQSLGGAVAIVCVSQDPDVKAVVIQAAFHSYRAIARDVLTRHWIMYPLYPFYPWFVGKKYDPERYVGKIAPRPILFIHGTKDSVIPIRMTEMLFKKAGDPKSLWMVEGADHNNLRNEANGTGEDYDKRVAEFFTSNN